MYYLRIPSFAHFLNYNINLEDLLQSLFKFEGLMDGREVLLAAVLDLGGEVMLVAYTVLAT